MKKLMITALAALTLLAGANAAQAEVLYKRLPNGQFVHVAPPAPHWQQRVFYTPAPAKWQHPQPPRYRDVRYDRRYQERGDCRR